MRNAVDAHPFADGFLSESARDVRSAVHAQYPIHFELARLTNRRAVALQHELKIHVHKLDEALGAALYARTLAFVQSSVILLEHGMPVQGRTVLRAGLESLFQLAALAKDRTIAPRLLASHDADRRTLADRIRRWRDPALRASIDSQLSEADLAAMSAGTGKSINIYDLAKLAEMEDWYLTIYTLLSFAAHSKVSDLDGHVVVGNDGKPIEFQNEPVTNDQASVWSWGVEVQLAAMRSTAALFTLEVPELEMLSKRLAELPEHSDGA
jgi:Family of unknown function (DUF5677)